MTLCQRGLIGLVSNHIRLVYSTLNQPMQRYNNERVITKVGHSQCFRATFKNTWYLNATMENAEQRIIMHLLE